MSVQSFLGFKKIGVSKESRTRQPSSIINILFLAVFACAYVYFPYSKTVNSKSQRLKAKQTPVMFFSTPPKSKRKSPKLKLDPFMRTEDQKKWHYLNEPLCEFVSRSRISRLKAGKSLKKSALILSKRGRRIKKYEKIACRPRKQRKQRKDNVHERLLINPNANDGPAALRILANPNKNAHSIEKLLVNPNSLVIEEKITDTQCFIEQKEKEEILYAHDKGDIKIHHPHQQQYVEAIALLQHKSLLLKTSILDSQERISELCDLNAKLEAKVRDTDALLQEKDDLIMGIQMQLMSYEAGSGNTPSGDLIHDDTRLTNLRNEHQRELNKLKNEGIERQLQTEKRISSLLAALTWWKERAIVLQSTGSEGPSERIIAKEWSRTSEYVDADPGTEASPNLVLPGSTISFSQQMQIESEALHSSRTSGQDVEMEDESIELVVDSDLLKPVTALDILQRKNFKLESQIYESTKTIGELNGEMRELECLNMQLSSQLDQEAGRSTAKNYNTRSTQTQPGQREIRRIQVKPRKLFSVSKILSCRKAVTDEKLNGCEKMAQYQRVMISQV